MPIAAPPAPPAGRGARRLERLTTPSSWSKVLDLIVLLQKKKVRQPPPDVDDTLPGEASFTRRWRTSLTALDYDEKLATGRWDLNRLVVAPGNPLVGVFDLIVAICVVFSSVVAPMKVAYRATFLPELEVLIDAIFWLDIALQFCSGFEERGYPVLSFRRIARRYASTWLVVDVLAVFPWELISRQFAFVPLVKTVRLVRLKRLLAHTKLISGDNVLRVLMILSFWLLVTHWCACIFFALGWSLCGSVYDETWVILYFDGTRGQGLPDLRDSCGDGTPDGIASIHVRALYWALATMSSLGYGAAPVAVTNAELVLGIFCQLLGACLAAAIFSNIAKLIEKLDAAGARYSRDLDKVDEFGLFYKLPRAMRRRLHAYVTFKYAVSRGIDIGEATSALPPTMQEEAFYKVHAHVLRRVPMFAETDDFFVRALVRVLRPQVLLKGDFLFKFNEPADSMFFIERGKIDITNHGMPGTTQHNLVVYCTLGPGSHFGELAMLTSQRRTGAARAGTDCILSALRASDFNLVIKDFPKYYDDIIEGAMGRLEATLQSNAGAEMRLSTWKTKKDLMVNHAINRDSSAAMKRTSSLRYSAASGEACRDSFCGGGGGSEEKTRARQSWKALSSVVLANKSFRSKLPPEKPSMPVTDAAASAAAAAALRQGEGAGAKDQSKPLTAADATTVAAKPASAWSRLRVAGINKVHAAKPPPDAPAVDSSSDSDWPPETRSRLLSLGAWKAQAAEDADDLAAREELEGLSYEEAARARAAEKFGMDADKAAVLEAGMGRRRSSASMKMESFRQARNGSMLARSSGEGSVGRRSSVGNVFDGTVELQQGGEIMEVLNELRQMMRSLANEVAELKSEKLSPTDV